MGEAHERETKAKQALLFAATRSTVLLINHRRGEDPKEWDYGSGTLLQAASGRLVVLSAWHILKERTETLLHIKNYAAPEENAIVARIRGPRDIGIAIVNDDVSRRFNEYRLPSVCLGVGSDCVVDRRVLVVGFPQQMQGNERIGDRARLEKFTCMATGRRQEGSTIANTQSPSRTPRPHATSTLHQKEE